MPPYQLKNFINKRFSDAKSFFCGFYKMLKFKPDMSPVPGNHYVVQFTCNKRIHLIIACRADATEFFLRNENAINHTFIIFPKR